MSIDIIVELSKNCSGVVSVKEGSTLFMKGACCSAEPVKLDLDIMKQSSGVAAVADAAERAQRSTALLAYAAFAGGKVCSNAFIHAAMTGKYVLQAAPAAVGAMLCGAEGKTAAAGMFPGSAWVDYCTPGVILAEKVRLTNANVVFAANYALFVLADTP